VAKFTKETRQKMSAIRQEWWARLSPAERQTVEAKRRRSIQLYQIKTGSLLSRNALGNVFVDPDFDEGL
jgi:hypothetical protein